MIEAVTITLAGTDYTVYRKEIEAPSLERTDLFPQFRFKEGDESPYLGFGILLEFDALPLYQTFCNNPPRILSAQDFFPYERRTKDWNAFPTHLHYIPEIELHPNGCAYHYSLTETFSEIPTCVYTKTPSHIRFQGTKPGEETYHTKVASFIEKMKEETYDKIVFARISEYLFGEPVPLFELIEHLDKAENAYSYCIRMSQEEAFVGASPELLFETRGKRIMTQAVAGTRPRGTDPETDAFYEEELLKSSKDSVEFEHVYKSIADALETITVTHEMSSTHTVVKTSAVQHLKTQFHGVLSPGVTKDTILKTLHPTPAVGGKPKSITLPLLYKSEPFDRGYYAAPIGYVTPKTSLFVVGIRSALIRDRLLTLYAGTGLVADSDPTWEWNELNMKTEYLTAWIHSLDPSSTPSLATL